MNKLKSLLLFLLMTISVASFSQSGIIRGTVFDGTTGEYLPGVTIYIESISHGTITDLDGKFNLKCAPGTYNLKISFISYETVVIEGLEVEMEEVTLIDDVGLKEATFEIASAVVTAQAIRNTETALLALKQKSPNVFDGISAASLRKTGDSDAASSIKRVTGVSVTNGKYVYVRGLGDRYTKTILNGVDVPGLDPDRNTIQMDIFPTNIIDNIIVHKSFSAELPADFTGGVVDIELKDFPEEKQGSISVGAGYNANFHFNSNYLNYEGGATDLLGFDDGTRDIPASSNIPTYNDLLLENDPMGENSLRYKEILGNFSPNMAAIKETSLMDYDFGISFGNQKLLEKTTIGYNIAFSYKNNTEFYEKAKFEKYAQNPDLNESELIIDNTANGAYGINNVFLNGLVGFAVKTKSSKYRINLIHLQNGESSAGIFDFISRDAGSDFEAFQHTLLYSQRSLTNLLIDGKHRFDESKWEIIWKLSPTLSKIEDPDIRFTRYAYRPSGLEIGTETGFPERTWRELDEMNLGGVLHLTKKFKFNGQDAKLKFGGAYTYKERNFNVRTFAINVRNIPLTGDPDELFFDENLWPYQDDINRGTTIEPNFIPDNVNKFDANVNYKAGYISGEVNIFKSLKTILGVRAENYIQRYTGTDQQQVNVLDNDKVLDELNFFPSVNLIYGVNEDMNLRISYSKTIARPSLKELSYAQIFDPVSGTTFIGGLADDIGQHPDTGDDIVYWDGNLVSTDIQNIDLRWEWFHERDQMVSLSGFYKKFSNPIEMVQFATTQKTAIQPRNVGDGQVIGVEIEIRQALGFINESFNNFSLTGNFTYVESKVKYSQSEYDSRVINARTGQTIDEYRDMAGQSPYLINIGAVYNGGTEGIWEGLEAGLFYNVQGKSLAVVGIASKPDIYTLPFHSLNFTLNKQFNGLGVGFKVKNILNSKDEAVYQAYQAEDQYYRLLEKGISFSLSLKYKF